MRVKKSGTEMRPPSRMLHVTPALVRLIDTQLACRRLEKKALGRSLLREYYNWRDYVEAKETHSAREATLNKLATTIGLDFRAVAAACTADFEYLEDVVRRVDASLLRLVRAKWDLDQESLREGYESMLVGLLDKDRLHPSTLTTLLEVLASDCRIVDRLPTAGLRVEVEDDFSRITFIRDGIKPLSVPAPLLLWDCTCAPHRRRGSCRIHGHPSGDSISQAFGSTPVEICWRGLRIRWRNGQELWPPSADTFKMIMTLSSRTRLAKATSILDLGSGTGALGLFAASASRGTAPGTLDLSDWLLTPALYGAANFALNRSHLEGWRLNLRVGMMDRWLDEASKPHGKYDLVLCNPPYLPAFAPFESLGQHSTVAGTDLLDYVIRVGPTLGRRVYVQYSSVADLQARRAAKRGKSKLSLVGKDRFVPFRVHVAASRPKYLEALRDRGGLHELAREGYKWWHTLRLRRVGRRDRGARLRS